MLHNSVENRDFLSEKLEIMKSAVYSECSKDTLNIYFFNMYLYKCMYGMRIIIFTRIIIYQMKENVLIL